jgi:hypothetical protein
MYAGSVCCLIDLARMNQIPSTLFSPISLFCFLASEAYSRAGSEESESSSYSDWESLDETEDPGVLQSVAAAAFRSYENKVPIRNSENLNTK